MFVVISCKNAICSQTTCPMNIKAFIPGNKRLDLSTSAQDCKWLTSLLYVPWSSLNNEYDTGHSENGSKYTSCCQHGAWWLNSPRWITKEQLRMSYLNKSVNAVATYSSSLYKVGLRDKCKHSEWHSLLKIELREKTIMTLHANFVYETKKPERRYHFPVWF